MWGAHARGCAHTGHSTRKPSQHFLKAWTSRTEPGKGKTGTTKRRPTSAADGAYKPGPSQNKQNKLKHKLPAQRSHKPMQHSVNTSLSPRRGARAGKHNCKLHTASSTKAPAPAPATRVGDQATATHSAGWGAGRDFCCPTFWGWYQANANWRAQLAQTPQRQRTLGHTPTHTTTCTHSAFRNYDPLSQIEARLALQILPLTNGLTNVRAASEASHPSTCQPPPATRE